jgi:uncharacterized protein YegJ (DUF2314 family)
MAMTPLDRPTPSLAAVFFPGSGPPPDGAFARLEHGGIRVQRAPEASADAIWSLELQHPAWGSAHLSARRDLPSAPEFVRFAKNLTDKEKAEASKGGAAVLLEVPGSAGVLRDRKTMLRYVAAVMGTDGVLAVDLASQLPWSPAVVAEELAHDADLDVEALYCIHQVLDDNPDRTTWLHTHGLGEIGAFDFDVVRPSADFAAACGEPFRAIAFHIVAGRLGPAMDVAQIGNTLAVRTLPVTEFMRDAAPNDRQAREPGIDAHLTDRSVLCEPVEPKRFRIGRARPEPLRIATFGALPEHSVLYFPTMANDLMAIRAQQTIDLLPAMTAEFAEFEATPIVKIGYPTDDGRSREHLWFDFHGLGPDLIDATLQNEPYAVSGLAAGVRRAHPRELLSDWMIQTPFGSITPRSQSLARTIRENAAGMRQAMADWKAGLK